MAFISNRRQFLGTTSAAALGAELAWLGKLRPITAGETELSSDAVQFRPEIEPLVRLLEETPRERLIEEVAARIAKGLSYQELLAALLLAGVRNVQPRPAVGFKFHAVLVVNSAHIASLASPAGERWLPIFWALDYFKSAQAQDVREGNWTMQAVDDSRLPDASKAKKEFIQAMENWDEEAADHSIAALARSAGSNELFELFARFGARDFRSIGHKAIFVANAWRTLHCIGWQHSEPVLRSLAYALQNHTGESNPAKSDHAADRPWRENQERVRKIRSDWRVGKPDPKASLKLVEALRTSSPADACEHVVEMLNSGVAAQSVWDALLLSAAECLIRQPGIVALHTVTTTNAMMYAYQTVADDETRRLLMLQNAAFLPMFMEAMKGRGKVSEDRIDGLEPVETQETGPEAIREVFAEISRDRMLAARKMLWLLRQGTPPQSLIQEARRMVFLKGNDSHDYKFSSAVLEDYFHTSPEYRDLFLASSVFKLCGAGEPTNGLVERAQAALT